MSGQIRTAVENITPTKAKAWLNDGGSNFRRLSMRRIDRLAASMRRGEWCVNGESIVFSNDGALVDGWHRMNAVVKSGVTIQSVVCRGVDANNGAVATLDTGAARKLSDFLHAKGTPNAITVASGLRAMYQIANNGMSGMNAGGTAPTTTELLELLKRRPQIVKAAQFINASVIGKKILRPQSVMSALWVLLGDRDAGERDAFFEDLRAGVRLTQTDPVYNLRNRIIKNYSGEGGAKARITMVETAALTIKAWNMRRQNQPCIRGLRWQRFGGKREDFPTII